MLLSNTYQSKYTGTKSAPNMTSFCYGSYFDSLTSSSKFRRSVNKVELNDKRKAGRDTGNLRKISSRTSNGSPVDIPARFR